MKIYDKLQFVTALQSFSGMQRTVVSFHSLAMVGSISTPQKDPVCGD
jgi:hypothetical protein